eukprot:GEMP01085723.1.p1 GENE.GEMP01085723.1~~GEMP01085723.1.p1  ORF type:complete len:179 (+),score=35.73 GEMP01085723.1:73-609(+)
MMHIQGHFHIAFLEELCATILLVPHGERLGMLYLLPEKGTKIAVVETALHASGSALRKWLRAHSKNAPDNISVALPRFKIESQHDLIPSLQLIGIHDVFNSSIGIRRCAKKLYCSSACQKAIIQIEAAIPASSADKAKKSSKVQEFAFDRPFLFVIADLSNNVILFAGRVANPTKTAA